MKIAVVTYIGIKETKGDSVGNSGVPWKSNEAREVPADLGALYARHADVWSVEYQEREGSDVGLTPKKEDKQDDPDFTEANPAALPNLMSLEGAALREYGTKNYGLTYRSNANDTNVRRQIQLAHSKGEKLA